MREGDFQDPFKNVIFWYRFYILDL